MSDEKFSRLVQSRLERFDSKISPIEGWFSRTDATIIAMIDEAQREIGVTGDIVELGVYKGKSFFYFSSLLQETEQLHGFDFFVAKRESLESFLQSVDAGACEHQDRCHAYRCNTLSLKDYSLVKNTARLIHIDGDHEHDGVLADLSTCYTMMDQRGSVICMDDVPVYHYPGVWSAVATFLLTGAGRDLRPFLITGNKMYLCKKPDLLYFRDSCAPFLDNVAYRNVFDVSVAVVSNHPREKSKEPEKVF